MSEQNPKLLLSSKPQLSHKRVLTPSDDFKTEMKDVPNNLPQVDKRRGDFSSLYPKPLHDIHDNNALNAQPDVPADILSKPVYDRVLTLRFYAIAMGCFGIFSFLTIQSAKELFGYPHILVGVSYVTSFVPVACAITLLLTKRTSLAKVLLTVMLVSYGVIDVAAYIDLSVNFSSAFFNGMPIVPIVETGLGIWTWYVLNEVRHLRDAGSGVNKG